MNRIRSILLAIVGLTMLFSCNYEINDPYDREAVRAADIQAIEDLIQEKGWPEVDTTESGARYFIIKKK